MWGVIIMSVKIVRIMPNISGTVAVAYRKGLSKKDWENIRMICDAFKIGLKIKS